MRTKRLVCTALLLCSSLLSPVIAQPAVQVTIDNKLYQFDAAPRLAAVLEPVALKQPWYWPASALYQLDSPVPEQQRQKVLTLIASLLQHYAAEPDVQQSLQSVQRQVKAWRLARRIAITIDYDAARINAALNPRLDAGEYLLQLTMRPAQVYPFGAVKTAAALTHQSAAPLSQYVAAIEPSELAELSQLVILQPDMSTRTVGIAYWNQRHIEAMPGAQLFVPLKTALFNPQFEQLNQHLLELAVHRVLP